MSPVPSEEVTMKRWIAPAATVAVALALTVAGTAGADDGRREVRALILTTFGAEEAPLLRNHPGFETLPPGPGQVAPVHCWKKQKVCSTVTGTTKSNSGPTTVAVALDHRFKFDDSTLFIVAGIAGISSDVGTLGDVGVARRVVDVDLGSFFVDPADGGDVPGWRRFSSYDEAVITLDGDLAARALALGQQVQLTDDEAARAERTHYGQSAGPVVRDCDSMGSDGFFVGATKARQLHQIFQDRVREVEPGFTYRCAFSEFEDPGILSGLERFGWQDQTVVLRSGSDFEDQRPGETDLDQYRRVAIPPEGRGEFAGFDIACENHARVAWELAGRLKA
jgi:purine nucleoside permease